MFPVRFYKGESGGKPRGVDIQFNRVEDIILQDTSTCLESIINNYRT